MSVSPSLAFSEAGRKVTDREMRLLRRTNRISELQTGQAILVLGEASAEDYEREEEEGIIARGAMIPVVGPNTEDQAVGVCYTLVTPE